MLIMSCLTVALQLILVAVLGLKEGRGELSTSQSVDCFGFIEGTHTKRLQVESASKSIVDLESQALSRSEDEERLERALAEKSAQLEREEKSVRVMKTQVEAAEAELSKAHDSHGSTSSTVSQLSAKQADLEAKIASVKKEIESAGLSLNMNAEEQRKSDLELSMLVSDESSEMKSVQEYSSLTIAKHDEVKIAEERVNKQREQVTLADASIADLSAKAAAAQEELKAKKSALSELEQKSRDLVREKDKADRERAGAVLKLEDAKSELAGISRKLAVVEERSLKDAKGAADRIQKKLDSVKAREEEIKQILLASQSKEGKAQVAVDPSASQRSASDRIASDLKISSTDGSSNASSEEGSSVKVSNLKDPLRPQAYGSESDAGLSVDQSRIQELVKSSKKLLLAEGFDRVRPAAARSGRHVREEGLFGHNWSLLEEDPNPSKGAELVSKKAEDADKKGSSATSLTADVKAPTITADSPAITAESPAITADSPAQSRPAQPPAVSLADMYKLKSELLSLSVEEAELVEQQQRAQEQVNERVKDQSALETQKSAAKSLVEAAEKRAAAASETVASLSEALSKLHMDSRTADKAYEESQHHVKVLSDKQTLANDHRSQMVRSLEELQKTLATANSDSKATEELLAKHKSALVSVQASEKKHLSASEQFVSASGSIESILAKKKQSLEQLIKEKSALEEQMTDSARAKTEAVASIAALSRRLEDLSDEHRRASGVAQGYRVAISDLESKLKMSQAQREKINSDILAAMKKRKDLSYALQALQKDYVGSGCAMDQ